jgi:hypothetical protein
MRDYIKSVRINIKTSESLFEVRGRFYPFSQSSADDVSHFHNNYTAPDFVNTFESSPSFIEEDYEVTYEG